MPDPDLERSRHARGIAWMLASIVCFTGSITIARGLADEVPVFVMVFFRAVFGVLVMLPWLARVGLGGIRTSRIGMFTVRSVLAAANLATLSHRAMSRAYAAVDLSYLAPLDFMRPPTAAVLGWIAFAEVPDEWVWAGGAVIFAASIHATRRRVPAAP